MFGRRRRRFREAAFGLLNGHSDDSSDGVRLRCGTLADSVYQTHQMEFQNAHSMSATLGAHPDCPNSNLITEI